jgi:hypothetical protein
MAFVLLALRPFDDDTEAVGFAQQTLGGKSSFSPLLKTLNLLVEIEAGLLLKLLIIIDRSKQSDDRDEKSIYALFSKERTTTETTTKTLSFFFFSDRM